MTPTPTDLAAYLRLTAGVLGEGASRLDAVRDRVRTSGRVEASDFLVLAEVEASRLRAPAGALLLAAEVLSARPPSPDGAGPLSGYLVLLAQTLRREASALDPVRDRAEGDIRILVDGVRAGLLEQASLCLMLSAYLDQ